MKTNEELFLEGAANFKRELETVMIDFYGDFVTQHMPFVTTDTETNSWYQTQDLFKSLLEGKCEKLPYPLDGYCGKKIRAKIFEDFRDEIIELLNQDNLDKIKDLEQSLKWANEANERYRRY